ncbi:biotin--[acetyl-CoA-carboxylase] ligase [Calditrichota bacterium GD2]
MLNCDIVRTRLKTMILGRNLYCFQIIDSTNAHLLDLARDGAPEGTVVLSEFQTAGRGRKERRWFSSKGKNLLLSILLRPELEIEYAQKITLASAIILANTIDQYLKSKNLPPVDIRFKWPNDLLVNNRKLSGILAESILQDKKIVALVLGVGINLNEMPEERDPAIRERAVSLKELTGADIDREDFLCLFLENFEKDYERFERTLYRQVIEEWKRRCNQFGQKVLLETPFGEQEAIVRDINDSGFLVYEDMAGKLHALVTGEIISGHKDASGF